LTTGKEVIKWPAGNATIADIPSKRMLHPTSVLLAKRSVNSSITHAILLTVKGKV
jgi:hypothetical protein